MLFVQICLMGKMKPSKKDYNKVDGVQEGVTAKVNLDQKTGWHYVAH